MKTLLLLAALTLPLLAEETKPPTKDIKTDAVWAGDHVEFVQTDLHPTVEELKAQIEKLQAEVKSCSAVREVWKGLALQDAVQKFVQQIEQKAIDADKAPAK